MRVQGWTVKGHVTMATSAMLPQLFSNNLLAHTRTFCLRILSVIDDKVIPVVLSFEAFLDAHGAFWHSKVIIHGQ